MKKNKIRSFFVLAFFCSFSLNTYLASADTIVTNENTNNEVKLEAAKTRNIETITNNELNYETVEEGLQNYIDNKPINSLQSFYKGAENITTTETGVQIIETPFQWNGDLNLTNKPDTIFLHHIEASRPGSTIPVTDIHQWHLNNGWAGIGYHFYVTKTGKIYRGRPEEAIGAHVLGHNVNSLGIAAEGKYNTETMPQVQRDAIVKLCKYLRQKYNIANIYGHGEVMSTDCPGQNYPLNYIRNTVLADPLPPNPPSIEDGNLAIQYEAYLQDYRWQSWFRDGQTAGTTGQGKRIEALKIRLENAPEGLSLRYRVHVQDKGWLDWKNSGELSGTMEQGLRIEAIQVELQGPMAENYSVEYKVHGQDYGWQNWVKNGQVAGTTGQGKRIEAFEVKISKKNSNIGSSNNSSIGVQYRVHGQDYGWQNWTSNALLAGTTGAQKRIEALNVRLINVPEGVSLKYRVHGQNYGWQDWKYNGDEAGTVGQGLRLEAIQLQLEGANASKYSIEYRVHGQDYGWQQWVKDGEVAGTTGQGKRIEALEIKLVNK
jgi:uncharacterized protein YjdB